MDINSVNPRTFTGKDLEQYIENIKAANLQAVTWSVTVEIEGHYPYPTKENGSSPSI